MKSGLLGLAIVAIGPLGVEFVRAPPQLGARQVARGSGLGRIARVPRPEIRAGGSRIVVLISHRAGVHNRLASADAIFFHYFVNDAW